MMAVSGGIEYRAQALDALGDPENPLSSEAVRAKAAALMAWGGMATDAADRLIAVVEGLGLTTTAADLSNALPGEDA